MFYLPLKLMLNLYRLAPSLCLMVIMILQISLQD